MKLDLHTAIGVLGLILLLVTHGWRIVVVVSVASGVLTLAIVLFSGWVLHVVLVAGFVTALWFIRRHRERADTSAGDSHGGDVA